MSCSDMAYLTHDQIRKDVITYEIMRTRKTVVVPLIAESKSIMDHYQHKCYSNYVFPIFLVKHKTDKQPQNRIEYIGLKVNKTLVKVCKQIRFRKKITLGSARAAYIARMLQVGVDPFYIAQSTEYTTEYICKHFMS